MRPSRRAAIDIAARGVRRRADFVGPWDFADDRTLQLGIPIAEIFSALGYALRPAACTVQWAFQAATTQAVQRKLGVV
jgi:hypothetical protein